MKNIFEELTVNEMLLIEGGSIWKDISYGIGYIAGCMVAAAKRIKCVPVT